MPVGAIMRQEIETKQRRGKTDTQLIKV